MDAARIVEKLGQKFGKSIVVTQRRPDLVVKIPAARLLEVARFLKEPPGLDCNYLIFVTAVDRKDHFEVVYGARSLKQLHQVIFKVSVPAAAPRVPSVTAVWPAADWDEREVYDLFGIEFAGHPNLTRILLPDDWEGHPLRKSYPVAQRPARIPGGELD